MSNIYYLLVVTSVMRDGSKGVDSGISDEDGWRKGMSNAESRITTMHS